MKRMGLIAEQFLNYSIERFQHEKLLDLIDEASRSTRSYSVSSFNEKLNQLKVLNKMEVCGKQASFCFLSFRNNFSKYPFIIYV